MVISCADCIKPGKTHIVARIIRSQLDDPVESLFSLVGLVSKDVEVG